MQSTQHKSPQRPEPKEPGDLGLGLSKDDASLQTRMKEEPSFNGKFKFSIYRRNGDNQKQFAEYTVKGLKKAKERKRWYYGAPKHTQEDMFKEIELGLYTDPRTRTRRSKYSLPPKNTLEEKDNRPSRAKHLAAKKRGRPPKNRGRPPKKKVPVLQTGFLTVH